MKFISLSGSARAVNKETHKWRIVEAQVQVKEKRKTIRKRGYL
jgi:hypothetical protein